MEPSNKAADLIAYCIATLLVYTTVLILLALRRLALDLHQPSQPQRTLLWTGYKLLVSSLGLINARNLYLLPSKIAQDNPLPVCGLRIASFFYACKLLDLACTKTTMPPILLHQNNPANMRSISTFAEYIWHLATEMRYHSFNTAATQPGRPRPLTPSILPPFLAAIPAAALAYIFPALPELKCVTVLLLIQAGLETVHTTLHPRCPNPLFYGPFTATSMSAFWTTHWQACASPFLYSLAYRPVRKVAGRGVGVLAAFSLSGVWHGWASAALVEDEYARTLGVQVWGLFVWFGVLCLAERWIWGKRQGGWGQGVVVWSLALLAAGRCFRSLEKGSRIEILRR